MVNYKLVVDINVTQMQTRRTESNVSICATLIAVRALTEDVES